MTVAEMDTLLAQFLDDEPETANGDGDTWKATHRLAALNSSLNITVSYILGFSEVDNSRIVQKVFDLLSPLHYERSFEISAEGRSLEFDDYPMVNENAFIDAAVEIDNTLRPCVRYKPDMNVWMTNRYFRGSNIFPVISFKNGKVYLDIDPPSYPVTMRFRYVRMPKKLVISNTSGYEVTTCELFSGMHELIVVGAEKICRRMNNEIEKLPQIDKEYFDMLNSFIVGQVYTPANPKV